MPVTPEQVISGTEWDALSSREQEQAVEDRLVFARMSPEHKVQIVQTLERIGRVCAMVGDGANDAAAIRAASVGIGVASRGSDPARGAADVVLLDGKVGALLDAVDEGRQLWRRVDAAVAVLLGGNAGEVAFALLGSVVTGRCPRRPWRSVPRITTTTGPARTDRTSRRCCAPSRSGAPPRRPGPPWHGPWPASPELGSAPPPSR